MAKLREAMDQLAVVPDIKTDEVHVELQLPPPCNHPAVDKLRKVLLDGVATVQAAIKKAAADLERRTVAASQHVQAVCRGRADANASFSNLMLCGLCSPSGGSACAQTMQENAESARITILKERLIAQQKRAQQRHSELQESLRRHEVCTYNAYGCWKQ